MNDVVPPSAPTGLNATAVGTTINLSWTAATDDVGVVRYNVHRGTSAGFTPSTANRIAQPTGTTHSDPGLGSGDVLLQGHGRRRRGQRRSRLEHGERDRPRHDSADCTDRRDRQRRRRAGHRELDGRDRQRRRRQLQRPPLDDFGLHADDGEPDRAADGDGLHGSRPRRRHLLLQGHRPGRGRKRRAAGQRSERHGHGAAAHRPRRLLRPRRRQRRHRSRPVGERQQRHADERDLGRRQRRQVRKRPLVQRHERIRERASLELARPDARR